MYDILSLGENNYEEINQMGNTNGININNNYIWH